jgi:predicted nucleotidyltransferase
MNTSVLQHDLEFTRKIVLERLKNYRARVYLFGSQATGKARLYSDIDVAIMPLQKLPVSIFSNIHEDLEESDILRKVDVIDLNETDESFRQRVEKEGIVWKG